MAEDHVIARVGVTAIVNMQPDMTVVAEAANGQQAIELYRQHRPDITLLDLRMPDGDRHRGGPADPAGISRRRG